MPQDEIGDFLHEKSSNDEIGDFLKSGTPSSGKSKTDQLKSEEQSARQEIIDREQRPFYQKAFEMGMAGPRMVGGILKSGYEGLKASPELLNDPSKILPTAGETARRIGMDIVSIPKDLILSQIKNTVRDLGDGRLPTFDPMSNLILSLKSRTPNELEIGTELAMKPMEEAIQSERNSVRFEGAQPEVSEAGAKILPLAAPFIPKGLKALQRRVTGAPLIKGVAAQGSVPPILESGKPPILTEANQASAIDKAGSKLPVVGDSFKRRIVNKAEAVRNKALDAQDADEIADALAPRQSNPPINIPPPSGSVGKIRNSNIPPAAALSPRQPQVVNIPPPQGGVGTIQRQAARNETVKNAALDAMDAGIDRGALKQMAKATPEEKSIFKKMADDAESFADDRDKPDSSLHVGNEFKTRIEDGQQVAENLSREIDRTVRKIKPDQIGNARMLAFERMQKNPLLRGIQIDGSGNLIFNKTSLNGVDDATARSNIQANFDHLNGMGPEDLHFNRQSIAKKIDLYKQGATPISEAHDAALNSIRQGSMDALGPDYAMLEEMQAKVVRPLEAIRKNYRGLEGASDDILKEKGALLGRRLTQNSPSAPQLRANLEALENAIVEHGGQVNTSISKLADAQNLLDEVYGIRKKGSLAGQVKLGTQQAFESSMEGGKIPTSTGDVAGLAFKNVGKSFQRTDAVKRAAFKKFMKHLENSP